MASVLATTRYIAISQRPVVAAQSAIVRFRRIVEHSLVFAFNVGFGRRADDTNVGEGARDRPSRRMKQVAGNDRTQKL